MNTIHIYTAGPPQSDTTVIEITRALGNEVDIRPTWCDDELRQKLVDFGYWHLPVVEFYIKTDPLSPILRWCGYEPEEIANLIEWFEEDE